MEPRPNQALQRTLRSCHSPCFRTACAIFSASLSLRSLGDFAHMKSSTIFFAVCVAAPGLLALAYPIFPLSFWLSAVFTIAGLAFSCVLFVWSLLNLVRHWRRSVLGFVCLIVAFGFLVVMADIFAMNQHRDQSPNKSPEPTAVGAVRSAIAVHVAGRRWLSFLR